MSWYTKVSKDISYIPDAVAHFETELQSARKDTKISGNIEKASAATVSYTHLTLPTKRIV